MFFSRDNKNNGSEEPKSKWSLLLREEILKNNETKEQYPIKSLLYSELDSVICFYNNGKHLVTLPANDKILEKIDYINPEKTNQFIPQYPDLKIIDDNGVTWIRDADSLTSEESTYSLAALRVQSEGDKFKILKYGSTILESSNLNILDLQLAIDIAIARTHIRLVPKSKPKSKPILKNKSAIMVTTETFISDQPYERLGVITAECSYGMNIFKDIFAGVRDIVGGRSKAVQNLVKESKDVVIDELKQQVIDLGGDAIIGVDLDYTEFGHIGMFLVIGNGTAIRFKK